VETVHVLRTHYGVQNPALAEVLLAFLLRSNVEVADADRNLLTAALRWTTRASGRRIPDAILVAAAQRAGCDWIATFDESFASPTVPSRLL
jgi:predicted nucleic acid-binding protein